MTVGPATISASAQDAAPLDRATLLEADIPDLQAALASGRLTSVALVDLFLARIDAYDGQGPGLNAVRVINPEARAEAAALDRERRTSGARGPLHGIPLIVKDNYQTRGLPTSAGSVLLEGFSPQEDATMVARLKQAGAIVLAKSNMHELAYGIESYGSLFGDVRNPYDPTRNAGGSSGGTGAAVAARFAAAGLGSDTCGSIRIPAAHNNLVGLRPTMGLTSRHGIVPLALTQDVGGPIARSVTDVAVLMDAMVGFDPRDPVTGESVGRIAPSYVSAVGVDGLRGARLGVLVDLFGDDPEDGAVVDIVRGAIAAARHRGATLVELRVPELAALLKDASVVRHELRPDLQRYLAAFPEAPVSSLADILASGRFHPRLTERLKGAEASGDPASPEYLEKIKRRAVIRATLLAAMAEHRLDAVGYPPIRRVAAPIGADQAGSACTLSAVTGLPSLVVPAGFAGELPVGLELLGRAFDETTLLRLGSGFEHELRLRRTPPTTPALREDQAVNRGDALRGLTALPGKSGSRQTKAR
jgi:Asp-tRNA(Asn)/Glu-tRNA(Gln) amidotransferase A subunit family amidase